MVLVDTSVWVAHFRAGDSELERLLNDGRVLCHPFVAGELACGNLKNRAEILSLLQALPMALVIEHDEILRFVNSHRLTGRGIGYINIHLLASAMLANASLWTLDKMLGAVSSKLGRTK
ncbi:MAG: type II toxin-antitoxin system VapC family toxin [Deltaproteobacteria bacterium]|nr:type II toxin-antitoxin system VapC family toxin [Deltaproteobacteria bacterium]